MDDQKPKGFGEFDKLARKLVQVPPSELEQDNLICRRCGHTYAQHVRSNKYTVEACDMDGCECGDFVPRE